MRLIFYICAQLTREEKFLIDQKVFKNRRFIFQIFKNIKNKKLPYRSCSLAIIVYFTNLEPVNAIGLSLPIQSLPIELVTPKINSKYSYQKCKILNQFSQKFYELNYYQNSLKSNPETPLLMFYLTDPRLRVFGSQKIFKLVTELRGGWNPDGVKLAVLFLAISLIIVSTSTGFVPDNYNYGFNRQNYFQPHTINYPPAYNLLPRELNRHRPGNSQIVTKYRSHTKLSAEVRRTQTQMSEFVYPNGEVNLNKCLNEVKRRAAELGSKDFNCSIDRFTDLATEDGRITVGSAREALSALQGEASGYYMNTRRENYGRGVKGIDFVVDGIGEYSHITHVDIKNPVGSAIKRAVNQNPDIVKQGTSIGEKFVRQQNLWSNPLERNKTRYINPMAKFPQSANNILGVVDIFDVPKIEKGLMQASILEGSQKNTNIIFLNNIKIK